MGNGDEVSASEFSNYMVEAVENLIFKVEKMLPAERKIPGQVIQGWKEYTFNYFNSSPNAFLANNPFYHQFSSNLRVKVVKKNLLLEFQEKFDILFQDPDFGFKADDRLITQVIASLQYEHYQLGDLVMEIGEVSSCIYMIQEGQVDVSYKDSPYVLLEYDGGSYIGDTSYIFGILNQYKYTTRQASCNGLLIYSLQEKYLEEILDTYPEFKSLLKLRALRRHHYLRKLKN